MLFAAGLMLTTAGGCSRAGQKADKTPVETQTATTGPNAGPMTLTVTGCLQAGDAADTYVLTAARVAGATDTVTYQLVGTNDANLKDHVGERVQVSGTADAQAQVASRSPVTAEQERAKGTSGTPTVQTQTDVRIRRLRVDAVAPQGGKCETR